MLAVQVSRNQDFNNQDLYIQDFSQPKPILNPNAIEIIPSQHQHMNLPENSPMIEMVESNIEMTLSLVVKLSSSLIV